MFKITMTMTIKMMTIIIRAPSTLSGDIHFDDDEDWTVGSERGTDVIQVAINDDNVD